MVRLKRYSVSLTFSSAPSSWVGSGTGSTTTARSDNWSKPKLFPSTTAVLLKMSQTVASRYLVLLGVDIAPCWESIRKDTDGGSLKNWKVSSGTSASLYLMLPSTDGSQSLAAPCATERLTLASTVEDTKKEYSLGDSSLKPVITVVLAAPMSAAVKPCRGVSKVTVQRTALLYTTSTLLL